MANQSDNIILIGPMGSGKTSTGRILAKEMGFDFIDTDEAIVESTGVSIAYILMLRVRLVLGKESIKN